MDSTYLLQTTKWVLGEIVRLNSKASLDDTEKLVKAIAERQVEGSDGQYVAPLELWKIFVRNLQ